MAVIVGFCHILVPTLAINIRQRDALPMEVRKKHSHLTVEVKEAISLLLSRLTFVGFVSLSCRSLVDDRKKQFE